jgi:proteasome lid subunit RPN8/RPN11
VLRFPADELRKLHAHALEGYPHEVVGILAGDRTTGLVRSIRALRNERADSPQNRYQVSALVMMRAEQQIEADGLEVVGYYHSHPDHPARYSDFDRLHALPNMSYLITAIHGGPDGKPFVADTLSWRLTDDRTAMDPEPVTNELE